MDIEICFIVFLFKNYEKGDFMFQMNFTTTAKQTVLKKRIYMYLNNISQGDQHC